MTEGVAILRVIGVHHFGDWVGDDPGMYKSCDRCGKLRKFKKPGPDGWEQARRYTAPGACG